MTGKEMCNRVQELKELSIENGFKKPAEVDKFFDENWMVILDILDDALFCYYIEGRDENVLNRYAK